ncbi:MAG: hypothetical protein J6M47_11710 [Clostridia bacterium]|nr:hypothetical protein [Clostridia bacterium]
MKKMMCILLAMLLIAASCFALAEEKTSALDVMQKLKQNAAGKLGKKSAPAETAQEAPAQEAAPAQSANVGPEVRFDDPFYENLRTAAYLHEDKYSKEGNVFIELRNVSGRTLYPDTATVTAYKADGTLLQEKTYANIAPDIVPNGEKVYVWEWFYNFDYALADVGYYVVTLESETDSYTQYEPIAAESGMQPGIAYATVTNPTDAAIYGISAVICVENEQGQILDVQEASTGSALGIAPGSTMILRTNVKDYAADDYLQSGITSVCATYQVEK